MMNVTNLLSSFRDLRRLVSLHSMGNRNATEILPPLAKFAENAFIPWEQVHAQDIDVTINGLFTSISPFRFIDGRIFLCINSRSIAAQNSMGAFIEEWGSPKLKRHIQSLPIQKIALSQPHKLLIILTNALENLPADWIAVVNEEGDLVRTFCGAAFVPTQGMLTNVLEMFCLSNGNVVLFEDGTHAVEFDPSTGTSIRDYANNSPLPLEFPATVAAQKSGAIIARNQNGFYILSPQSLLPSWHPNPDLNSVVAESTILIDSEDNIIWIIFSEINLVIVFDPNWQVRVAFSLYDRTTNKLQTLMHAGTTKRVTLASDDSLVCFDSATLSRLLKYPSSVWKTRQPIARQ